MDKININEINFKKLKKFPNYKQGTMSTIYTDGKICIKRFNRKTSLKLEDRFSYLEESNIKELVIPKTLLMNNGRVAGYEIELLKDSKTIFEKFSKRTINSDELLKIVKELSLLLRKIHKKNIIISDLNFDNIMIDKNNNIKIIDLDYCGFDNVEGEVIPQILYNYASYCNENCIIENSENTDRISIILNTIYVLYFNCLETLKVKDYEKLSQYIKTLENMKETYIHMKKNTKKIVERTIDMPYIDEYIEGNDNYIINRNEQLPKYYIKKYGYKL